MFDYDGKLTEAEEAFATQLAKDFDMFTKDGDGAGNVDEIDRFYYIRFMSLFSVMEAYLRKGDVPQMLRQAGLEKLFMLSLQSFKAVMSDTMSSDKKEKSDG